MRRTVLGTLLRVLGVVLLSGVLLVAGRAVSVGKQASAASDTYHPLTCLGGWESPQLASGKPSGGDFSLRTSAYLAPNISTQLFCGQFGPEPHDHAPTSVLVSFKFWFTLPQAAPAPVSVPNESGQGHDSQPSDQAAPADTEPLDPAAQDPDPVPEPQQEPVPVHTDSPAQEPEPETPAASEPASAAPQESQESATLGMWLLSLGVPHAHAQSLDSSGGDFLQISYSFDGVHWVSAGSVGVSNWQDYTVSIPTTSWEELAALQIMVSVLPSLSERPPVYLESVSLKVNVDRTLGELVSDAAVGVGTVVDGAVGVLDAAAGAVLGVFTSEAPQPAAAVLARAPAYVAPPARQKQLRFDLRGSIFAGRNAPDVSVSGGGASLTVSGPCKGPYFVVLTYRSREDYERDPRDFASNYAGECKGDSFTYDMKHLPTDTPEGTYYLLVAAQDTEGPWKPVSDLVQLSIRTTEVEVPAQP